MDLKKVNMDIAPSSLLEGLRPYLLLEFIDFPYLIVSTNNLGTYFLNYYVDGTDIYNRILIEITEKKLKAFILKSLTLKECFDNPENGYVYYAQFDQADKPISVNLILAKSFIEVNPIDKEYDFYEEVELSIVGNETSENLLVQSRHSGKIIVDVYLKALSLRNNLKYWAIKGFLVPFIELVRSSLLNNGSNYNVRNLDESVGLGLSRLKLASLSTSIELSNPVGDLFNESSDLKNLQNLFGVLNATTKDEIITSVDNFSNKRFIIEYVKVLNSISKYNATLNTKMATPTGQYFEVYLDRQKATAIKKVIDEYIPVESTEDIQGTLLELAFNKKEPTFSMAASFEDYAPRGHINAELVKKLKEHPQEFIFFKKLYTFVIHTKYNSQTSTRQSRIENTLIDIKEVIESE